MIRYSLSKNHSELEGVQKLIQNFVADENTFLVSYQTSYRGNFKNNTFKIIRTFRGRNSFLPVIKGTIQKDEDNRAYIKITMRPHLSVILFLLFVLITGMTGGYKTFFYPQGLAVASLFLLFFIPFYAIEVANDMNYLDEIFGKKHLIK